MDGKHYVLSTVLTLVAVAGGFLLAAWISQKIFTPKTA